MKQNILHCKKKNKFNFKKYKKLNQHEMKQREKYLCPSPIIYKNNSSNSIVPVKLFKKIDNNSGQQTLTQNWNQRSIKHNKINTQLLKKPVISIKKQIKSYKINDIYNIIQSKNIDEKINDEKINKKLLTRQYYYDCVNKISDHFKHNNLFAFLPNIIISNSPMKYTFDQQKRYTIQEFLHKKIKFNIEKDIIFILPQSNYDIITNCINEINRLKINAYITIKHFTSGPKYTSKFNWLYSKCNAITIHMTKYKSLDEYYWIPIIIYYNNKQKVEKKT